MGCYRPTTLKLASAHCPRAVDFYEQNAPSFREHFAVGIAAHDVLAKIGELALFLGRAPSPEEMQREGSGIARGLMEHGRVFENNREPPMSAEDAFSGRDLALAYAMRPDVAWATQNAWYERGFAFDAAWQAVPFAATSRRFRLILDKIEIITEEGEDYAGRLAVVTDYKSAWPTDESELSTYQMRAQAVAVYLAMGAELDGIRLQVTNLRTGKTFGFDLWFESGGREQIEAWQSEITDYMAALDAMTDHQRRPARPGIGCLGCPYALGCEADIVESDRTAMAQRLGKLEGEREQLIKALKAATAESPIQIADCEVGYEAKLSRTPKENALAKIKTTWFTAGGDLSGLMACLKPTMAMLSTVAKKLYPESKEDQAAIVEEWSTIKQSKEFGIHRPTLINALTAEVRSAEGAS